MIKNIVFDLGKVLVDFFPNKFVEENVEPQYRDKFLEIVFNSDEWKNLDRGTLEYEDAIKILSSRLPQCEKAINKLFNDIVSSCLSPIKNNAELLPKLKENYNLYIISNFHRVAFEEIYKDWEFFKFFDGKVVSAFCKLMKPEPEIYQLLFKTYSLNPNECIFIDDVFENIEGAKNQGMEVIHLTNPELLKDKLIEKGIKL